MKVNDTLPSNPELNLRRSARSKSTIAPIDAESRESLPEEARLGTQTKTVRPTGNKSRHSPPAQQTNTTESKLELGPLVSYLPGQTFAHIDAEIRHTFPEENWFGLEFQKRAAPHEQGLGKADTHNTGSFTVWGPALKEMPEETRPYATDSSILDKYIAKEESRRPRPIQKFDQLVRHGLVTGDYDRLRPLLAIPNVDAKEEERRKKAAQKLVNTYIYESSDDEVAARYEPKPSKAKPKKGRLAKLKQALAKLERPPGYVEVDRQTTVPSQRGQKRKTREAENESATYSDEDQRRPQSQPSSLRSFATQQDLSAMLASRKEDPRPTLGFQRAMRDPSHPDFGMSFSAALEMAMAKEKKAKVLAMPDDFWDSGDDESETSTVILPMPKRQKRTVHASLAGPAPQASRRSRRSVGFDAEPE